MLDEKARSIMLLLTDPLLDPSRWQGPEATNALKRALKLLVHDLILREKAPGEFHVEVQLYEIRQSLLHASAWESNPPAQFVTPPNGFEDRGSYRATCQHACSQLPKNLRGLSVLCTFAFESLATFVPFTPPIARLAAALRPQPAAPPLRSLPRRSRPGSALGTSPQSGERGPSSLPAR